MPNDIILLTAICDLRNIHYISTYHGCYIEFSDINLFLIKFFPFSTSIFIFYLFIGAYYILCKFNALN